MPILVIFHLPVLPCTSLEDNFTFLMLILLHVDVLPTFPSQFEVVHQGVAEACIPPFSLIFEV